MPSPSRPTAPSPPVAAPSLGENSVKLRTFVPGQAPRMGTVTVRRVERLSEGQTSPPTRRSVRRLAAWSAASGQPVVLSGEIVESRSQGAANLALPTCRRLFASTLPARLVFAGEARRAHRLSLRRAISPGGDAAGNVLSRSRFQKRQ
jgi:hypothetical protein